MPRACCLIFYWKDKTRWQQVEVEVGQGRMGEI